MIDKTGIDIDHPGFTKFCFKDADHSKLKHRKPLTKNQQAIYDLKREGFTNNEIAKLREMGYQSVASALANIKNNG